MLAGKAFWGKDSLVISENLAPKGSLYE